jgi:hypothetical protein
MLGELDRRLVAAGVHRIQCLLADASEIGAVALEHAGYTARQGMVLYERLEPVDLGSAGVLGELGGRMVRAGAWDELGGMAGEKELIERRVILPLAQPQLAERLGLVPPRAAQADIEFAARRTAQLAFERVLFEHGEEQVTTGDVLRAVGQTRRTLTPELVAEFEQDIQAYARV